MEEAEQLQNLIEILKMVTQATSELKELKISLDETVKEIENMPIDESLFDELKYLEIEKEKEISELLGTINQVRFSVIKLSEMAQNEEQINVIKRMEMELAKVKYIKL